MWSFIRGINDISKLENEKKKSALESSEKKKKNVIKLSLKGLVGIFLEEQGQD